MIKSNSSKRLAPNDYRVCADARPGWVSGQVRTPVVGEEVYCAQGVGEVVALLGKTGDGSRLVQIRLTDGGTAAYFAAASNLLVAPS